MRLLVLVNNPQRASFRLRIADYLPFLARNGIQCDVHKLPGRLVPRWRLLKSAQRYDGVFLHRKCLNVLDAAVLSRHCRKLIFDFDDAVMYSTSRPQSDHTSHFRLFQRAARMADVVIAGNEYLAEHARRFCGRVHVLPTGLDTKEFEKQSIPKQDSRIRLVWIGSQSTLPYLKQLRPVFERIGKNHKQVILRVIADDFFDLENMTVEKVPWSLHSEGTDLLACDIGLAPLPDNRFTRGKCGFKILQYFAAGLPVIASAVGVNRKFIEESGGGILAGTSEQWTLAIEQLIGDRALCRRMGSGGKCYVQSLDRSIIGEQLCSIIREALHS